MIRQLGISLMLGSSLGLGVWWFPPVATETFVVTHHQRLAEINRQADAQVWECYDGGLQQIVRCDPTPSSGTPLGSTWDPSAFVQNYRSAYGEVALQQLYHALLQLRDTPPF